MLSTRKLSWNLSSFICLFTLLILNCPNFSNGEPPLILTEHVDFVFLRLQHLLDDVPTDIQGLRQLLQKELDLTPAYKEAWTEGTTIFNARKAYLSPSEGLIPDEYHIALITYTIHDTPTANPFFSIFNVATRTLCSGSQVEAFPYKSFFQLLRFGIRALNQDPKYRSKAGAKLYRGVTVRHDFKEGVQVAFQSFVSLSMNRSVSETYSQNVTLLEFEKMGHVGLSMEHHSKFPGEAEILVSPLQVYKVTRVPRGYGKDGYDLITLEPIDEETEFKYFTKGNNGGGLTLKGSTMIGPVVVGTFMVTFWPFC